MSDHTLFVAVGTDHHPFDRVLQWVAELPEVVDGTTACFAQHGTTDLPATLTGEPLLAWDQLQEQLATARAVVTHGGPGLIIEARAAGHTPVVVPRQHALGEHVDDHQRRFCRRIAEQGSIRLAEDHDTFQQAVRDALDTGPDAAAEAATPGPVVERFAHLVDAAVSQRKRR